MPSHRSLRMAEAIREVIAHAILFEVSDPRVKGITVLHVEVSGDLRNATIFISIMGNKDEQENAMRGLKSATGFLTTLVAARLQSRSTPVLAFRRDEGIKKSIEMSKLIEDTLAADRAVNAPHPEAEAKAEAEAAKSDADPDDDPDTR
jgi:ribosome-binding factor A